MRQNLHPHVQAVKDRLEADGHELMYLVQFGSHLYGTNNKSSDLDLKGIFRPSKESCFLNNVPKHYTFSTGDNNSRNTSEDVDTQLWSVQYWLELLGRGETNAIDLLYSHTYPKMVLYDNGRLGRIFRNHQATFDLKNCNSYVGYAIGQSKKYGVRGSRLGVVKRVLEFLDKWYDSMRLERGDNTNYARLFTVQKELLEECQDDSYCFIKDIESKNGEKREYLFLCGAKHDTTIFLSEFYNRVRKAYETYGERAKSAERNEGIDWKAISHAFRAAYQMLELLQEGKIQYPLKTADFLKSIKNGEYTWKKAENALLDSLEEVDKLRETVVKKHHLDSDFIKTFILYLY